MSNLIPEVSIIMPTFNRASLINESLSSIADQTFLNWECLIIDDHSTDNTFQVAENFILNDKRFKLFKRPKYKNKGANSCRNYGLEMSRGEFIHWFDSDDIAHPMYLEVSLDLIKSRMVDFCRFSRSAFRDGFHYNFKKINSDFKCVEINSAHIEPMLKNEIIFNTCNVLWRKRSLREEKFNEDIVYADEWEFYSRLLSNNLVGISVDLELFFGRKHANSTTYEFANKDKVRKESKVKAVKLVTDNLIQKGLLTEGIIKYFIQLGFMYKELDIINYTLEKSNANVIDRIKYKFGYHLYPFIKLIFHLKAKYLKS